MTTRAQVVVQAQGTQGPPGLQWKGSYSTTAAYNVRDLVRDGDANIVYVVIKEIAANSGILLSNTEYFEVFSVQISRGPGLQWKGTHQNTTAYEINDLVRNTADNSIYIFVKAVSISETVDFTDTTTVNLVLQGVTVQDTDIQSLNAISGITSNITALSPVASAITTLSPVASDISTAATNNANITTVATNLNQGAASEIVLVGDNITDVTTVATQINNTSSALNTASTNATAASNSASAASGSAGAAATSETNASTSATNAATDAADAEKLAINATNSQFTLSDGTQGYSAKHYADSAQTTLSTINSRFLGGFPTTGLPSSASLGSIAYDSTTQKLVVWNGSNWLTGLEGPDGPTGGGINSITYDADQDTLNIVYDAPGTVQANDARIGSQSINFGSHAIYFKNQFASLSAIPSATSYPGMIATVVDTGKVYISKYDTAATPAAFGWFEVTLPSTAAKYN